MAEKILVISTYPPKGSLHNHPFSAVAMYTKNTLLATKSAGDELTFLVLADEIEGSGEKYNEEGIEIIRCWRRNDPFVFFSLFRQILEHKECHKVLFAFEWAMFGKNKWVLGYLPIFLLFLKGLKKKVYFVSHGVLLEADKVALQMGVSKDSLTANIWSLSLKLLYHSIVMFSYKTVVFEEYLRRELVALTAKKEKIVTVPFGVEPVKKVGTSDFFKKKLGIKENELLVICFGYLTWYKGSDWLVGVMKDYFANNPASKIKLLMVGGSTKTYKSDPVYENFVKGIYKNVESTQGKITVTGFIDEKEIGTYYTAADLVVLPYRVLISSSGPLSLVFSYGKPFLLSDCLAGYEQSEDFSQVLTKAGLTINDLTFSLKEKDLLEKIDQVCGSKGFLEKITGFSTAMYEKRKWPVIGREYYCLLK